MGFFQAPSRNARSERLPTGATPSSIGVGATTPHGPSIARRGFSYGHLARWGSATRTNRQPFANAVVVRLHVLEQRFRIDFEGSGVDNNRLGPGERRTGLDERDLCGTLQAEPLGENFLREPLLLTQSLQVLPERRHGHISCLKVVFCQ